MECAGVVEWEAQLDLEKARREGEAGEGRAGARLGPGRRETTVAS